MVKINDIKIIYGAVYALILLAILVLGLLLTPAQVNAEGGMNYFYSSNMGANYNLSPNPYNYNNTAQYPYQQHYYTTQQPYYYPPVQAQQQPYYYPTMVQSYYYPGNTNTGTTNNTETNSKNSTTSKNTNTTTSTTKTENITNENTTDNKYSELASNAIFGDTSFTPSGLLQWILFAILILVIIIMVRKIFGKSKQYYNTPLKHA